MGILSWIIVGFIAGWLAGMVIKGGGYGVIADIIFGIMGAILGGWIASALFNLGVSGIYLESILVALLGSIVLILLVRRMDRRARRRSIQYYNR